MKTEPIASARKRIVPIALCAILLLAAALRVWHIGFGLPDLNDPDEPVFVMTALDMLREHRLDPEWFGHPATLLLYVLALIFVLVGMIGSASGKWHGIHAFVMAVYADPGVVIVPMRLFIVGCGLATIVLTYRLGRRVAGPRVGLIAALMLACNALHVELSQIIRTDMLATALMLWSIDHALSIAGDSPRGGTRRDHVLAGIGAGLACATKWPAVLALVHVMTASLWSSRGRWLRRIWIAPVVAIITLIAVSPYLVFDYRTVLHDLGGEARKHHLGATGHGLGWNLVWYIRKPLAESFGWPGLALAACGMVVAIRRHRIFAVALLPGAVVVLLVTAAQALIWERWAVPLLPAIALCIALGLDHLAARLPSPLQRAIALATGLVLVIVPMTLTDIQRTTMRADDTRQAASAWVRAHVAPDRSVLIEQAAFSLLDRPGPVLFPLGNKGCIEVHHALSAPPSYKKVNDMRADHAIVDIGNVDPALLPGCTADVAIFSHYRRYGDEAALYGPELSNYRALLRNGRILRTFTPIPGRRGGPIVDVVLMRPIR